MDAGEAKIFLSESKTTWRWTRGYAADMAHAITLAVIDEGAAKQIYNVGESEALITAEWVRAIAQAAGWQGEVVVMPEEALPEGMRAGIDTRQDLVVDTSRIRGELGYAEMTPRDEALRRTVAWERAKPPASSRA